MNLYESGENYLKRIFQLEKKLEQVRSVDLAREMGVSKPSVSHAVAQLRDGGYLHMEDGGALVLTECGQRIAEELDARCQFFQRQLIAAGIAPETAKAEACRMEHTISTKSFQKLQSAMEHMEEPGEIV